MSSPPITVPRLELCQLTAGTMPAASVNSQGQAPSLVSALREMGVGETACIIERVSGFDHDPLLCQVNATLASPSVEGAAQNISSSNSSGHAGAEFRHGRRPYQTFRTSRSEPARPCGSFRRNRLRTLIRLREMGLLVGTTCHAGPHRTRSATRLKSRCAAINLTLAQVRRRERACRTRCHRLSAPSCSPWRLPSHISAAPANPSVVADAHLRARRQSQLRQEYPVQRAHRVEAEGR